VAQVEGWILGVPSLIRERDLDWPPLGLKPEIVNDPAEAKHFDGYASVAGYKGDAEECFINLIENEPNFRLLLDKEVETFLHADNALGK